jgi:hypothetical protein
LGAWGTALFSDDVACDVRDAYKDLITDGTDDAEATRQVLSQWSDTLTDDPDDAVVVWLALAVTQSRLGRLEPGVAERALQIIDAGGDLERWAEEGPNKVAQRQSALDKARAQLTGPQPARKIVRLPRPTGLQPGDVLAFRTREEAVILFRVARIRRNRPLIVLLDYAGPDVPPLPEISRLADYQFTHRVWDPHPTCLEMSVYKRVGYEQAGYTVVGNIGTRTGDQNRDCSLMRDWQDYLPDTYGVGQMLDRQQAREDRTS